MVRLNKYLAKCGIGSRRKCDEFIQQGRVTVNGVVERHPGFRVNPNDLVLFDGQPMVPEQGLIYLQLYKPRNTVTTVRDPQGRETVMKYVANIRERIYPIGRLDYDSEGLLLFTNDGKVTNILTHPRYQIVKTYRVYVSGQVKPDELKMLIHGIEKNGKFYHAQTASIVTSHKDYSIAEMSLNEGKKHEVRILFESISHPVLRLIRIKMGPITLDEKLLPGEWRYLNRDEVRLLFERGGLGENASE